MLGKRLLRILPLVHTVVEGDQRVIEHVLVPTSQACNVWKVNYSAPLFGGHFENVKVVLSPFFLCRFLRNRQCALIDQSIKVNKVDRCPFGCTFLIVVITLFTTIEVIETR